MHQEGRRMMSIKAENDINQVEKIGAMLLAMPGSRKGVIDYLWKKPAIPSPFIEMVD